MMPGALIGLSVFNKIYLQSLNTHKQQHLLNQKKQSLIFKKKKRKYCYCLTKGFNSDMEVLQKSANQI